MRCLRTEVTSIVFVLALAGQAAAVPILQPSSDDLWDISQGSVVTAHSPVLDWGGYYVSDIRNMFGYENVGYVEYTKTLFGDAPKGFVHWVEWETPEPITLRSFVLISGHDGEGRDANARGFSRFSLFAEGTPGNFDIQVYELFPSNPYSTTPAPPNTFIESRSYEWLELAANVTPVTSQRFRAEFVQYGDSVPSALGPRVHYLDGFDTFHPAVPEPSSFTIFTMLFLIGIFTYRGIARPTK